MATRAARAVAQRNLLVSYAKLLGKEEGSAEVTGVLRRVREVRQEVGEDGRVRVTLAVSLDDVSMP